MTWESPGTMLQNCTTATYTVLGGCTTGIPFGYCAGPLGPYRSDIFWSCIAFSKRDIFIISSAKSFPRGEALKCCCTLASCEIVYKIKAQPQFWEAGFLYIVQKDTKKRGQKPRDCRKFSLTKGDSWCKMKVHTVILCLFLDFTSNMVILTQEGAAVK